MRDYLTKKELTKLRWDSIERLQQKRFAATVRYLLPHTKAYATLFARYAIDPKIILSVEDWQKFGLPLFKKKYYLRNPSDFVVAPPAEQAFKVYRKYFGMLDKMEQLHLIMSALLHPKQTRKLVTSFYQPKTPYFSGGTESGHPTPAFLTAHQKKLMERIVEQIILIINDTQNISGATGMNLFPYGPHLAWHATHLALELGADLNVGTAAGGAIPTERLATLAYHFKPKIFAGMHSYLTHRFFPLLARKKPMLPVRALIMNGGQKMSDGDRKQLTKAAQGAGIVEPIILDLYGASELKEDLLPECSPNSGFHHIAPLSTIIRTIKPFSETDDLVIPSWDFTPPEKGGYAAIWTIDGAGTLFEGYVLGDHYGKITHDRCPACKLLVERIHDINRIKDIKAQLALTGVVEEKIKGTRINLTDLRDKLLNETFVKEVQLVVEKGGKGLTIRFASALPSATARLQNILVDLEITPVLEQVPYEKLLGEKMKFEPIVVK